MTSLRRRAQSTAILVLLASSGVPAAADAQQRERGTWDKVQGGATTLAADAWKGVEIFADNTFDVVTFPKDFDSDDWKIFGGVLAVGAGLYAVDGDIQDWFRRNDGNSVKDFVRESGDFFEPLGDMGETNAYYMAGMAIGYLTGWDRLNWIGQDMLFSHFIASLTRKSVRAVVGRHRPEFGAGPRSYDPFSDEGTSFPSGHASSAFQVAAVFSHHIDNLPLEIALYTMAATVAFQRVDSGGHWASDTWIGSAWGWGVSQIVLNNGDRRRGLGDNSRVRVGVDPTTGMVAFTIAH